MFTTEEIDAIAVGVRLLRRLRDRKLQEAAETSGCGCRHEAAQPLPPRRPLRRPRSLGMHHLFPTPR
jgi:hypothetical protein